MKISILTDNPRSWFLPFGEKLVTVLAQQGHETQYVFSKLDIATGDICFLLSCVRIVEGTFLARNKHNIVVHASDLPQGKGFSPLQWQVLEGKDRVTLTLLEAAEAVDAGPFYFKTTLTFDGTELYGELRSKLGERIIEMCLRFVAEIDSLSPIPQQGADSFYRRRTTADDELDVHASIAAQFNHFRIADNELFPVYFRFRGQKYLLKIYKAN